MIRLAALDKESGYLNAIIDTPKCSRNKFKYDEQLGLFKLAGMLPVGNVFPFDFGYIPSTRGDDSDGSRRNEKVHTEKETGPQCLSCN